MPDQTDKDLPWVSEYTDGSFRAWNWEPEKLMEALGLIYRRQYEILELLKNEKAE